MEGSAKYFTGQNTNNGCCKHLNMHPLNRSKGQIPCQILNLDINIEIYTEPLRGVEEKFEDTKGQSEAVNLRYQRAIRSRKSKIPKGNQKP